MWDQSLWELFWRGGPVMWPLLASSVVGLALMLDRMLALTLQLQSFHRFVDRLRDFVTRGDLAGAQRFCRRRLPLSQLALVYLTHRHLPQAARADVLQREGGLILGRLETRVRWLAIVGQLSPMLGLLGTVTGLVTAFHQIEIATGHVEPAQLAAGIWEALLTTVFGLVIAIPCMAVYHACETRIDTVAQQFGRLVSYLDQWFLEAETPAVLAVAPIQPVIKAASPR